MDKHEANIAEIERRHRAGDKRAVLDAIYLCISALPQKPVPFWALQAFWIAFHDVIGAKAGSWDDVFGKPWPSGHVQQNRRRIVLRRKVWRECQERRADGAGISDKLFGEVAEKFGIGTGQARELYYEGKRFGWPVVERGRRVFGAPIVAPKK